MTKKNSVVRKPRTHFEQIPFEAVKKIVHLEDSRKEKPGTDKAGAPKVRRTH